MKITRLKLATFVALLLNINQSQASALQIIDDANWGAASIIYDSATGLDWLKPIITVNKSYNFINSQLGLGFYSGFYFADQNLIAELLTNAGLPLFNTINNSYLYSYESFDESQLTLVNSVINMFGATTSADVQIPIVACINADQPYIAMIQINTHYGIPKAAIQIGHLSGGGSVIPDDGEASWIGSWLVRTHTATTSQIPEPTIIALLLSGLIGLGLSRRKKYHA